MHFHGRRLLRRQKTLDGVGVDVLRVLRSDEQCVARTGEALSELARGSADLLTLGLGKPRREPETSTFMEAC
jgi:hypothetical protein